MCRITGGKVNKVIRRYPLPGRVGGPPGCLREDIQAGRQPVPKQLVIEAANAAGGRQPSRLRTASPQESVSLRPVQRKLHAGCKGEEEG